MGAHLTILVSGASGLVGSALVPSLEKMGFGIARLLRPESGIGSAVSTEIVRWDPLKPLAPERVSGFEAVIHLAGENVAGRWTAEKKSRIRGRIPATANLARALSQAAEKPHVFVSASAIGYYGNRGDDILNEESPGGAGFAADLARDWEAATQPATEAGIRTVQMRVGIVLAANGGALGKMLPPFKMGLGGRIGDGHQWMSWIDLQDVVGAIHHVLKTEILHGPVNLVAPNPVTNAEFSKTLAQALSRPAIFPMPAFAARLAFGEMADELLLSSQRVQPAKLCASGYSFRFPELRASLKNILA